MGLTLTGAAGRAVQRIGRKRPGLTAIVLTTAILIGGGLALWARIRLDALLEIHPAAEIMVSLDEISGLCGTPSLYFQPQDGGSDRTDYLVLVDMLGGPNRFPGLGGTTAMSVLVLPESRRPGVGLGRGLPEHCNRMVLRIAGDFDSVEPVGGTSAVTLNVKDGVELTYDRTENSQQAEAMTSLFLRGVPDTWQFGHKRLRFANASYEGVNIFLYEEPGYLFLNEYFSFLRPPNVRRSYVDIHLERMGGQFASSADVVRRRPTSDLELQQALINLSTVFGIGISLLVEGVLVLLVSFAGSVGTGNREKDDANSRS